MANELTTPDYWDCDCEATDAEPYRYILSRDSTLYCPVCNADSTDAPNSRIAEVVAAGLPVYPCPKCAGFGGGVFGVKCDVCQDVGLVYSPELLVTGGTA